MFAVIKTGGKQYKVSPKDRIKIEKLDIEDGKSFDIKEVLLVADEKGEDVKIGNPYVKGSKVTAKAVSNGKAKKVMVVKYKNKTRYLRRKGHRQPYTEIEIQTVK